MPHPVTQEELKQVVDNLNSNIVGTANAISQNLVGTANNLQENQNGLENQIINVTKKFPNLGIFSYGDFSSLINGPWQVYKMPAPGYPKNVSYRYISKNGDKLLCWGPFPSVLSALSTNELENKEGLITSLSFYNNGGPLCGSKINSTDDSSLYYQSFNSSPFVYASEEFPFIANLSEVEFIFDNEGGGNGSETFTESITVTSCTNKHTNKAYTITELKAAFGDDAKYIDPFSAFKGTLVNTFSITQDDMDNIPGNYTPPPPSVYATKLYLGDNAPDKNSVLPATIMNPVDQNYLSFLKPYRTGNEYNPISPEKGLTDFDNHKILGGSYVIPYSENCPGTITLQTCLHDIVPWSKTGLLADGINNEGTAPVPDNRKILSNPYVQQYFQYALAPMFYWEHYFGMDLTKSTNAATHGLIYKGDGSLTPTPAFVEQAKNNPEWASLKDQIWKGNTSYQNLWNTTWQLVNSTRDAFNAAAYGFDPTRGELQDYFNINWVNHGVAVAELFEIPLTDILINDSIYGLDLTNLSLLQAHITNNFTIIYFGGENLGYYATYNEVEKIVKS